MKRTVLFLAAALLLVAATAFAGHGEGHAAKSCSMEAQACINYIAKDAQHAGWIGIEGEIDEATGGWKVTEVLADSPAQKAGFKKGQVLAAINGTPIQAKDEVAMKAIKAMLLPDATITVTLADDYGKKKDVKLTLQKMPEAAMAKKLGQHMMQHVQVAEGQSR